MKTGYTFGGWEDQDGNILTKIALDSSGALTLTAQWTVNTHTFTYQSYDGQTVTTVNNKAYGTALGMTAPTRTGYTFDGWIDIDTEASYSSTSTMPDKNLDLIGEWTINNYTI